MAKPKLLPQGDVKEVVRFREYLRDHDSHMPHQEFANKYSGYLGLTESAALAYSQWNRGVAGTEKENS